jgi:hypothetical protein
LQQLAAAERRTLSQQITVLVEQACKELDARQAQHDT